MDGRIEMGNVIILAQDMGGEAGAGFGLGICLVELVIIAIVLAGMWKAFVKAGHPGWAAIVPFYNLYVMTLIARREILWFILLIIPIVNIVASLIVSIDIAKKFRHGAGFGVGLWLLGFVFWPILGFGDSTYDANA
jgi:hypothetical protein